MGGKAEPPGAKLHRVFLRRVAQRKGKDKPYQTYGLSGDEFWDSWSHSENEDVEVVGRLSGLTIALGKGPPKSSPKGAKMPREDWSRASSQGLLKRAEACSCSAEVAETLENQI